MSGKEYVRLFEECGPGMKDLLGIKGARLAEMAAIGLPVPPGLIITTEACREFFSRGGSIPPWLMEQIRNKIGGLEKTTGKKFGDPQNPLLVSIRSGTPVFIPGIADTVLNLGINRRIAEGLAGKTGDRRFALDCLLRFLYMFGSVAMGIEHRRLDAPLQDKRPGDRLEAAGLEEVAASYTQLAEKDGRTFPEDPMDQVMAAVRAVFASWNDRRARLYRKINSIPDSLGAAVIIQAMVFGNMGDDCGVGSAFTRSPVTGANDLYGEYMTGTQGEDAPTNAGASRPLRDLEAGMPGVYRQLLEAGQKLEKHYRNMQHVDFVIQRGNLYILHARSGRRTIRAAIRIAVDMAGSKLITRQEAVSRVDTGQVDQLLHRRIKPSPGLNTIALGLAASPGAASGKVFFDSGEAENAAQQGEKVILVRTETLPEDLNGMIAAGGILTSRGGMASHAAVVARGMGKPCVCGCEALQIDCAAGRFTVGRLTVKKGDIISIDGSTGQVILGEAPITDPELPDEFRVLLSWCDEIRTLGVRANADTPGDAEQAKRLGADGIGLARTEHMFLARDRLPLVREMIMASSGEERARSLEKLLPLQRDDFYRILKTMAGMPVTIRLLDPPLHEFLPGAEDLAVRLARLKLSGGQAGELEEIEKTLGRVKSLSEFNPMLGHRGCRLGITYPEIYATQARAVFEACAQLVGEGLSVLPEVEIPLVMDAGEFKHLKEIIARVAGDVMEEAGVAFVYQLGTMIELPRAALLADEIAAEAEFFSFGTNDLTQTTLGFSRDDAEGKFLATYLDKKIFRHNPFETLDTKGVGKLMEMAVDLGRRVKPGLVAGICGEHGGDPRSIEFCRRIGLDYVSCSPFRLPRARLAAAQAEISSKKGL